MSVMQELLGQLEVQHFVKNYLFKHPYAEPSRAKRFENLISWNLLKEIFSKHQDCWLPCCGRLPTDAGLNQGTLTAVQAQLGFLEGRTVLVRHAEKASQKLAEVANEFYQYFNKPIDIQLYATPAGAQGFDWHYDVEDVFVIQSAGEKEFRLLPNTVTPRPLPMMSKDNVRFHQEKKAPEIRCWLKPGDWLYIPAGYWHKAEAITNSFHLSVGVMSQPASVF